MTRERNKRDIQLTIKLHILPYYRPLGLIFFVCRNNHHSSSPSSFPPSTTTSPSLQSPPTYLHHKPLKLRPLQRQPPLQHFALHLATTLSHTHRDAHPHQFLKSINFSNQIGVQVVAVEGGPESFIIGLRKEGVERG